MHYEVERLVELYHPPAWVPLAREGTGHPRRFRDLEAAEGAARRSSRPGPRRVVLVRDDGGREVVGPGVARHVPPGPDPSPNAVPESPQRPWRDAIRQLLGSSR